MVLVLCLYFTSRIMAEEMEQHMQERVSLVKADETFLNVMHIRGLW